MKKYRLGRAKEIELFGIQYESITAALKAMEKRIKDPILLRKTLENRVKLISERLRERWSSMQAFGFEPPPTWASKSHPKSVYCQGKLYGSRKELAASFDIPYKVLCQRLDRDKMTPEEAVELEAPAKYREQLELLTGCIYLLRLRQTGQCYVGLTIDPKRRIWQHFKLARPMTVREGTIQEAISNFGRDAFDLEILEENIPGPELGIRERHWIRQIGSIKPQGFNQNAGGVVGGFRIPIQVRGKRYLGLGHVAEAHDMSLSCLTGRIKLGWSVEDAIEQIQRQPKTRIEVQFELAGVTFRFRSIAEARRFFKLKKAQLMRNRSQLGMDWSDAIRKTFVDQCMEEDAEAPLIRPGDGSRRGQTRWQPPNAEQGSFSAA